MLKDIVFFENAGREFIAFKKSSNNVDKSPTLRPVANTSADSEFHCEITPTGGTSCPVKKIKFYMSKISSEAFENPDTKFLLKVVRKYYLYVS